MPDLTSPLDPAILDALVDHLRTGGGDPDLEIREVSPDPTELNLPGVLVQVSSVEALTLAGGLAVGVTITCLAPELSARAFPVLADLWNRVSALVGPFTGPTEVVTVVLPDAPGGVPGLQIPYTIQTC